MQSLNAPLRRFHWRPDLRLGSSRACARIAEDARRIVKKLNAGYLSLSDLFLQRTREPIISHGPARLEVEPQEVSNVGRWGGRVVVAATASSLSSSAQLASSGRSRGILLCFVGF